ncbi:MAG TPA: ribonuclease D [Dongiaceae bacterium]|nr:ribonuclease D [Dongiaceae bacterium]
MQRQNVAPVPVTESADLVTRCAALASADFVALDTEFLREKTYYPIPCLIQVAGPDSAFIIDPMAPGIDLAPFLAVLRNRDVVKVFHAGRQDLDIFFALLDELPAPLADTQIMAMALGYGDAVSYENLAARLMKVRIDKGARFTDWSRRPLTPRQLEYALSDVTHLRQIYALLSEQLKTRGREEWIAEEMADLNDPARYRPDPEDAWRRLKIRSDKPRFLLMLRELAAWREREAQQRNVPRQRIIKDEILLEIAAHPPHDQAEFDKYRGLPNGYGNSALGKGLAEAIARGQNAPFDSLPVLSQRVGSEKAGPAAELLRVLIKQVCENEQVAPKLLVSSQELDMLARLGPEADVPLLHGWRYELCGKLAQDCLAGKLAFYMRGNKVDFAPFAALEKQG